MESVKKTLAKNLVRQREKRGLTQEAIAELCDVSLTGYRFYEYGRRFPRADQIDRFAQTLGIRPEDLFKREDEPPPQAAPNAYRQLLETLAKLTAKDEFRLRSIVRLIGSIERISANPKHLVDLQDHCDSIEEAIAGKRSKKNKDKT